MQPLLPIPDVGRLLGYTGTSAGKSSIYKLIAQGRLIAVRIGGRTFVPTESVENLIRRCAHQPGMRYPLGLMPMPSYCTPDDEGDDEDDDEDDE